MARDGLFEDTKWHKKEEIWCVLFLLLLRFVAAYFFKHANPISPFKHTQRKHAHTTLPPKQIKFTNAEPPLGRPYNGFAFKFPKDVAIYFVENDQGHVFPDWETFTEMGFTLDRTLFFKEWQNRPCAMRSLPMGAPILNILEQKKQGRKYAVSASDLVSSTNNSIAASGSSNNSSSRN